MKLVSYLKSGKQSIGLVIDEGFNIVDIPQITNNRLPADMKTYLLNFEENNSFLRE